MLKMRAAVITVSDAGYRGERHDESGETLDRLLSEWGFASIERQVVPDERDLIATALRRHADEEHVNLIVTTGGTGLGPRDVTPEATLSVIERAAPGFAEAVRAESLKTTPRAMISRAVSGLRGSTLILNFPGSPKACREAFAIIAPALGHALELLSGEGGECAR